MGSDLGILTWMQSIVKAAGLDLIELPSADAVREA